MAHLSDKEIVSEDDSDAFLEDDDDEEEVVVELSELQGVVASANTAGTSGGTSSGSPQRSHDGPAHVPFSTLCDLFEKSIVTSKVALKKRYLQALFSAYSKSHYFSLLRLLVPQLDKERQTYGMKESNLAKYYVELLNISPESDDGRRLLHWRKPTSNAEMEAGDFGNAVYLSLRHRCVETGTLSIADVNSYLDQLNQATDRKVRVRVLARMIRRTTAVQQKWLVRIILKQLKTGLSEKTVLNTFHPDALELFEVSSNLRKVAEELNDPNTRLKSTGLALFHPVKPMLASRRSPEEMGKLLAHSREPSYIIETKFDGERLQIHKDRNEIKMFSRNSNEVSSWYGPKLIPIIRKYVPVSQCILDGELLVWDSITQRFEDFGKLKTLALHYQNNNPAEADTGANLGKQLCYIVFDLLFVNGQSVMELTLAQRMALLERCIPKPQPKILEIVQQVPIHSIDDIISKLDAAIINREEGVMIKDTKSKYVPNERKDSWVKLKPEYIEGIADELDLLIIGGYYGSGVGRRGGTISHFMLGVKAPQPSEAQLARAREAAGNKPVSIEEGNPGEQGEYLFWSFCKVGSGYTDLELKEIQKLLQKHWRVYDTARPPACIQLAPPFKEKPDVWIHPKHSRILQIKAAQLVPTDKFKAGYTLRFPRVQRIRLDKRWDQSLTHAELWDLANQYEGRTSRSRYATAAAAAIDGADDAGEAGTFADGGSVMLGKKRRRASAALSSTASVAALRRTAPTLLPHFQSTDTSAVPVTGKLFEGMEFCVMNGSKSHTKANIETLIHQYGGTLVQTPLVNSTFCVIAETESLKVKNIIKSGNFNVVYPRWLLDCTRHEALVALEPKYLLFANDATCAEFSEFLDPFGDHYTKDATIDTLSHVFSQLSKARHAATVAPASNAGSSKITQYFARSSASPVFVHADRSAFTPDEVTDVESRYFDNKQPWWGLFHRRCFYIDRYRLLNDPSTPLEHSPLELTQHLAEFYGATISDRITPSVTHVVVDPEDLSRLAYIRHAVRQCMATPPHLGIHVVTCDWVRECTANREDLDEREYYLDTALPQQQQAAARVTAPRAPLPLTFEDDVEI